MHFVAQRQRKIYQNSFLIKDINFNYKICILVESFPTVFFFLFPRSSRLMYFLYLYFDV